MTKHLLPAGSRRFHRSQRSSRFRGMSPQDRRAFTVVELLAVIAIIGTLLGMLLPAVQRARELSRRTACSNNVRNTAIGVHGYESARRHFPSGCDLVPRGPSLPTGTQHAWSSFILPFLGESVIANRIDYARAWNSAGGNGNASHEVVAVYVCPGGTLAAAGKSDYGGIAGSWVVATGVPFRGAVGLHDGMLFPDDGDHPPATTADVTDGLSRTLLVGEAVDRGSEAGPLDDGEAAGRWARINCFAQGAAFVNALGSDIASHHAGGAQAALADGRVTFLGDSMDPAVLSALCTRNGGEAPASSPDGS